MNANTTISNVLYCDKDVHNPSPCDAVREILAGDKTCIIDQKKVYMGVWHMVKDKLPPFEKKVLVTDFNYQEVGKFLAYPELQGDEKWEVRTCAGFLLPDVKAWFPIPEMNVSGFKDEVFSE